MERTTLEVWPGLLPVIQHLAPDLPCSVEEFAYKVDHRAFCVDADATLTNVAWLALIRDRPYLLVRHMSDVQPTALIAEAAAAMPLARSIVFCRKEDAAKHACDDLRRLLPPGAVGLALGSNRYLPRARVVVGTAAGLSDWQVEVAHRHFLFVPEAKDLLVAETTPLLDGAFRAHVVGLFPARQTLAPHDRDRMRCVYGFDELHLTDQGCERLPVEVVGIRSSRSGHYSPPNVPAMELQRHRVWRNRALNRQIADIVQQRVHDRRRLRSEYPTIATSLGKDLLNIGTTVIVDSVEHAVSLLDEMHDAHLVAGPNIAVAGLQRRTRERIARSLEQPLQLGAPLICLNKSELLQTIPWGMIDVAIVATQGVSPPAIDPWSLSRPQGSDRRLLLVDVRVGDCPALRSRWIVRQRAYNEQEWLAAGVHPVEGRIKKFLAERKHS